MSLNEAAILIERGRMFKFKSIKFNLRGEPTLHPSLPYLVNYAKVNKYVDIIINTHGQDLQKQFDILEGAGITKIIVSITSMMPEKYTYLHGVGVEKFNELHDGLRYIHTQKHNVKIILNCHYSQHSAFDFKELKRLYPRFKIKKRWMQKREGQDISIERPRVRKKKCPHMHRRLTVHANGQVYACCMSYLGQRDLLLATHGDFVNALMERKKLIKDYEKGKYRESCRECPSTDLYKWK
jgi:radical SAM protein with 4Fe4S-binding SPASM domain